MRETLSEPAQLLKCFLLEEDKKEKFDEHDCSHQTMMAVDDVILHFGNYLGTKSPKPNLYFL